MAKGDVGVGTIVGSAVFNIVCVIGICGLFVKEVGSFAAEIEPSVDCLSLLAGHSFDLVVGDSRLHTDEETSRARTEKLISIDRNHRGGHQEGDG